MQAVRRARSRSGFGRSAVPWAAASGLCFALGAAGAGPEPGLCDLLFKDVAEDAPIVAILEYHATGPEPAWLEVVEVIKGPADRERRGPVAQRFAAYEPVEGDRFLAALTAHHTLHESSSLGICTSITVLALRQDKLRGEERERYDGGRKALTLDEVRRDLAGRAADPNASAGPPLPPAERIRYRLAAAP
jgi:hypothetical protein